jgi:hypothetical protein
MHPSIPFQRVCIHHRLSAQHGGDSAGGVGGSCQGLLRRCLHLDAYRGQVSRTRHRCVGVKLRGCESVKRCVEQLVREREMCDPDTA